MKKKAAFAGVLLVVLLVIGVGCPSLAPLVLEDGKEGGLSGAIFTTLVDGSVVNHNIYQAKEDVYLDGGPGPNAPPQAAGLPEGWYYFQVTDPPGKTLLSTDAVTCRQFYVDPEGLIQDVEGTNLVRVRGRMVNGNCEHLTGIDQDHGALTVQLFPFDNTPNRGGVYKVWVTPQEHYDENAPGSSFGFVPRFCKTDNFKVKGRPVCFVNIRKFNDVNYNGCLDACDTEIGLDGCGWPVFTRDPCDVVNSGHTPWCVLAEPPGLWQVWEEVQCGWQCTGAYQDGTRLVDPTMPIDVPVAGTNGEVHEVIFLNGELGCIRAFKGYDADRDGCCGDRPVEGFQICLTGTDILGNCVGPLCQETDCTGWVCWSDLLPGNYRVTEVLCGDWVPSLPTCEDVCLEAGECPEVTFCNYCEAEALMHTKGFWQNPNGCEIVGCNPAYLTALNCLAPYASGCIDAHGQDNCAGVACSDVFLPFNSNSELGCYLVAPNSQDGRLGLAQQLCAFILNMLDQCGSMDAYLLDVGMPADAIIDAAIEAWQTGRDVQYWQDFIDQLNNAGWISYIASEPCPIDGAG